MQRRMALFQHSTVELVPVNLAETLRLQFFDFGDAVVKIWHVTHKSFAPEMIVTACLHTWGGFVQAEQLWATEQIQGLKNQLRRQTFETVATDFGDSNCWSFEIAFQRLEVNFEFSSWVGKPWLCLEIRMQDFSTRKCHNDSPALISTPPHHPRYL